MIKIGVTERGDAALDLSWAAKLSSVDGAIIITKNCAYPEFQKTLQEAYKSYPNLILHCTCTGWGSTWMEPNVPNYKMTLQALKNLDFPKDNCVLRIDPIIPNIEGLLKVSQVLAYANEIGLLPMRVRVSIIDQYPHVKARLAAMGKEPFFPSFYLSLPAVMQVKTMLQSLSKTYDILFESCAEPLLDGLGIENTGCVSKRDLKIFGLRPDTNEINIQRRRGCQCLANKCELLTSKTRCPHQCVYCYWND